MTLRRKLLLLNTLLFLGLTAVAAACLAGLLRQRTHVRASLSEYGIMKWVQSAQLHLANGKVMLDGPLPDTNGAAKEFSAAWDDMRSYKAILASYDRVLPDEITNDLQYDAKTRTNAISLQLGKLVAAFGPKQTPDVAQLSPQVDQAARNIAGLLSVCTSFVQRTQMTSDNDVRWAILMVGGIGVLILITAVGVSTWQYRRITVPMRTLRASTRRIASGDFSGRCSLKGDREFIELGEDFNRMADELAAFYERLERMVYDKSRELVRAERLASVGYLAAGVAHEINNPLNIMSGHAELSAKQLRRSPDEQNVASAIQALSIIREEAFRCKEITAKLLSLVKGGITERETVSLTRCASDVALMLRGLKNFQARKIDVAIDPREPLEVTANATEMKQIILNLAVNALEAVRPGDGQVTIEGRRDGAWIELIVRDNGRGMDTDTVERVFEPFYTEKRGAGEPGTGLGLSITHAIVTDHGGAIRANSAGTGLGSEFVVRLPAREEKSVSKLPSMTGSLSTAKS